MSTLSSLQIELHTLLEKDTNYPIAGSEDYVVRTALLNNAIGVWAREEGVYWNELFVSLADAGDGDKTTVAGQEEYDAPTDLEFSVGYLRMGGEYYGLIKGGEVQLYDNNSSDKVGYITGNRDTGKVIHILPAPATSGGTIKYEYYKTPALLSGASDVIEMSDPQFAIYWALAELTKDEDPNISADYIQIASNKLSAMRLMNDAPAWEQSNSIKDNFSGFGK